MAKGPTGRRLLIPAPSRRSGIPEVKTPWVLRNCHFFHSSGRQAGPQPGGGAQSERTRQKVSQTRTARTRPVTRGASNARRQPPPRRSAPHLGQAPQGRPSRAPGGRRPAAAGPARLGRGQGGEGAARRPAPREGLARWAPATHLRVRPRPGRRGGEEERLGRSPRSDGARRRPQPPAPGACFQIPETSRGRVSFRRPEIRAPPPPRRAHVTATRRRAQPGGRERERSPAPRRRGRSPEAPGAPGAERDRRPTRGRSGP